MPAKPIYVETFIAGSLDEVWAKTQQPDLHQQWDLRFSSIEYLPRASESEPQRFTYTTRIGFGLKIAGTGESVATKIKTGGESTSVLSFASDSPLSLIETGSGYWKYKPEPSGIRFITGYTYTPRYGYLGALLDLIFRPLIGWATAWSFDCLRIWIERGTAPSWLLRTALVQFVSKISLALLWIYHGLIPKLLFPNSGELAIMEGSGVVKGALALALLQAIGIGEIAFGLFFFFRTDSRLLYNVNNVALIVLTLGGLVSSPEIFLAPFNPFGLCLGMVMLGVIGLISLEGIPYGWRPKRKP